VCHPNKPAAYGRFDCPCSCSALFHFLSPFVIVPIRARLGTTSYESPYCIRLAQKFQPLRSGYSPSEAAGSRLTLMVGTNVLTPFTNRLAAVVVDPQRQQFASRRQFACVRPSTLFATIHGPPLRLALESLRHGQPQFQHRPARYRLPPQREAGRSACPCCQCDPLFNCPQFIS
jgi:hypothetical protein